MKTYRNIYIKNHTELPYEKMTGSITIQYSGQLVFKPYECLPPSYDQEQDMEIVCDCDFGELKDIKKAEVE